MLNNLARNAGDLWIIGVLLSCLFLLSYVVWSAFFAPLTRAHDQPDMPKGSAQGYVPGWTMVVNIVAMVVALTVLGSCKYAGLSWWIGVPVAAAIVVGEMLWERAIERKYRPAQPGRR